MLVAWVVALCAAVHAATIGPVDETSYAFGLGAVALVWVIRWDGAP